MKIFFVITVSEYGGAQSIVASLAEQFSKDHEVFILSGGNGEAWQHLKEKVHLIKISEHRKNISYKDIFLAFKLFYLRLKYKPDIVQLNSSKMGAIGRIVFSPKTIVYTLHGFDSVRKAFRKFMPIEKGLSKRSTCIIGVSQYDIDAMRDEGINNNLTLIYNGAIDYTTKDLSKIENPTITNQFEKIRQIYPKIILCISRISKQKKFDLFLDVAKQMPEYAFVWIGNKESVNDVPNNVFCLGEVHSAFVYFKYADLFTLPSNYEGLPVSLLEALSFGVPAVASAVGGVTEVLDGSNGFAVENNLSEFVSKIKYILDDDNRYKTMSANARSSYLKKFTMDRMFEEYSEIFQSVYNKNSK